MVVLATDKHCPIHATCMYCCHAQAMITFIFLGNVVVEEAALAICILHLFTLGKNRVSFVLITTLHNYTERLDLHLFFLAWSCFVT